MPFNTYVLSGKCQELVGLFAHEVVRPTVGLLHLMLVLPPLAYLFQNLVGDELFHGVFGTVEEARAFYRR